MKDEVTGNK